MKSRLSLMALMLAGLTLVSLSPSPVLAEEDEVVPVTLGNIESFEVKEFHGTFQMDNKLADGELSEYAKIAMAEGKVLPYNSPGQAVLHFDCGGMNCNMIKAKLTLGPDGPVLWKSRKVARLGLSNFERNRKRMAREIVKELEDDYQGSVKINPEKINIEN